MKRNNDLIEVFIDTREKYRGEFNQDTEILINNHTKVFDEPIADTQFMPHPKMPNKNMTIDVVRGGTVSTGQKYIKQGTVAILNFADAITPGGLLLSGATTQEENICRCSNLYASISSMAAEKYYNDNAKSDISNAGVYTDDVIYSKDVLFFKDDESYSTVPAYHMDVITCPAPSVSTTEKRIYDRVEKIIKVAALMKVDTLILGAWGCGAFGQNPEIVSQAFKSALDKYPAFGRVVFAIRGSDEYESKKSDNNYMAFERTFKGALI